MKTEIVNLVATAEFGEPIDLSRIAQLPDVIYNPSRYFCAYYKDDSMKAKVSIFASGKMIAVGAKGKAAATRDLKHVAKNLKKHGFVTGRAMRVTVRNIVVTVDIEEDINLEELQQTVPGMVYEPEQFPGAIFRPLSSDVTVLIFASGKMVVAGIKSEQSIEHEIDVLLEELRVYASSE